MNTRSAAVRLGLLAALLICYPLGLVAVRRLPSPAPGRAEVVISARWSRSDAGAGQVSVNVKLHNATAHAVRVRQIAISVLDQGTPSVTVIEDEPALSARLAGALDVAANGTLDLDTISIHAPEPVSGTVLLSLRLNSQGQTLIVTGDGPISK